MGFSFCLFVYGSAFLYSILRCAGPWKDKKAFQKALPYLNPSDYKPNIDLFSKLTWSSKDCKRVFTQQPDPLTAVQRWDYDVTVVITL